MDVNQIGMERNAMVTIYQQWNSTMDTYQNIPTKSEKKNTTNVEFTNKMNPLIYFVSKFFFMLDLLTDSLDV